MTDAARIDAIRFRYPRGERPALDGVSLDVRAGERFALLGPNGCGKSTLFKLLATLLPMQDGAASVFGHDVRTQRTEVRRQLGVVFQMPSLDDELSAIENLTHHGRLYGLGGADLRMRIAQAVERFDLAEFAQRRTGRLSGGQQRRVELAKALLHGPRLLLMDEPTSGLDPAVRLGLWRLIDELRAQQGLTVLLTTHLMDEADAADRVAILDRGRLVALDAPETLKACVGGRVFTLTAAPGEADAVAAAVRSLDPALRPVARDGVVRFEADRGLGFLDDLTSRLGGRVRRVGVGAATLDDVFLHATGRTLDG